MKHLAVLLILGAVLAVLRAVVIALGIAVVLALLVSLINRPRETLVFLVCLGLLALAGAQPLACIITLGLVAIVSVVANAKSETRSQTLLTDGCEHHSN